MVQYFPIVTGSLTVTGSVLVSGSITTNSTITATTLVVQTITSSISAITGSTNFGSLSSNTHTFTGSLNVTGSAATFTGNIGLGTISPNIGGYGANSRLLTVQGVNGSYGILELTSNSANADGSAIGRLDFGSDGQAANYKSISSIASFLTGSTSTKFGADLRFYTRADNAGSGDPNERMRITRDGNVGIGTTTPAGKLDISGGQYNTGLIVRTSSDNGAGLNLKNTDVGGHDWYAISTGTGNGGGAGNLGFYDSTAGNYMVYFKGNGNVGIGTTSPIGPLDIAVPAVGSSIGATTALQAYNFSRLRIKHYTDSNLGLSIGYAGANYTYIQACYNEGTTAPLFLNPFGGKITINTTDPGPNAQIISSGDQNDPYPIGAKAESASQGLIGFFNNANGVEGSISIASGVVSYNSFMGSHWSQLQDNSKPEILKGTVLETIDELCTWDEETNDRLAKVKISDTIESKNVYGVFLNWDNTDDFNDMYVAALGAGYIRVNGSQTVQMGDLLQSNGDGTAKVQSDDIVRSSTIAKVVSTSKIETYEDGSYLIAATLHCG